MEERYNYYIVNSDDVNTPILKIFATAREAVLLAQVVERLCSYGYRYTTTVA